MDLPLREDVVCSMYLIVYLIPGFVFVFVFGVF